MRDILDLRRFWQARHGQDLVLCTLIRKRHFGYRAVGAKKIVARDDATCGLLSGGCLEGDINRIARDNWNTLPLIHSFSTMDDSDRLFGYQTGCPGIIDILFEQMPSDADMDLYLPFGNDVAAAGVAVTLTGPDAGHRRFSDAFAENDERFFDRWIEPITLHIVGCGADAMAFAEIATPMGWTLRFMDYRGQATLNTPGAAPPEIYPLTALASHINEGPRSAVILIAHNFEADMTIFQGLHGRKFGYVGCLGPKRRYEQLKADLKKTSGFDVTPDWERIVHAPAGLFTSGRAPHEIALSVISQIQSLLREPIG